MRLDRDITWLKVPNTQINLNITHPLKNFGSSSRARTIMSCVAIQSGEENWMKEVCEFSARAAISHGYDCIVHVGYRGFAQAREVYIQNGLRNFIISLSTCTEVPVGDSGELIPVSCNPNLADEVEYAFSQVDDNTPKLIFFADIICRVKDPRPLLRNTRKLLKRNHLNKLLLATTVKVGNNELDTFNVLKDCFREWSLKELCHFMASSGFKVERAGYLKDHDKGTTNRAILEISCKSSHYKQFLRASCLPEESSKVLVTTEHGANPKTGGIGSYVQEYEKVSSRPLLILFVGKLGLDEPVDASLRVRKWLGPSLFFELPPNYDESHSLNENDVAEITWQTLEQVLFLYDRVREVECQEYLGIGCRIAQAKEVGFVPPSVELEVVIHGSCLYLERLHNRPLKTEHNLLVLKEKIAIEKADHVRFPTSYIRNLYRDFGYEIPDSGSSILRYPFKYSSGETPDLSDINTLIFFGKRSLMKGFDDFLNAVKELFQEPMRHGIQRLVIIGPIDHDLTAQNNYLNFLKSIIEIEEYDLERSEARELLSLFAPHSLCVLPYKGDNHPNTVLEAIDAHCLIVAYRSGGVPELIPKRFQQRILCDPNWQKLANHLKRLLSMNCDSRKRLVSQLRKACMSEQKRINQRFCSRHNSFTGPQKAPSSICSDQVTVVVAWFKKSKDQLRAILCGIGAQYLVPKEIIFISDASSQENWANLMSSLKQELRIPCRILHHSKKLGSATAKNTGLHATTTEYVIFHDSNHILYPNTIYEAVKYLNSNRRVSAVTHYVEYLRDEEAYEYEDLKRPRYLPLGQSTVFGQLDNIYGVSMATFRVTDLEGIGGWLSEEAVCYQAWSLYQKMTASRMKLGVIPKPGCMIRHNSENDKELRHSGSVVSNSLSKNTVGYLSLFDANRLQSLAKGGKLLEAELDSTRQVRNQNWEFFEEARRERDGVQAELDSAREERDGNWAIVESTRQERDTAWAELDRARDERDGVQAELDRPLYLPAKGVYRLLGWLSRTRK